MHISNKLLSRLAALAITILASGCFQAENPFYRKSDIITDKRFEGRFVPKTANTNSAPSVLIVIKPAQDGHYELTYHADKEWVKLDAVLFKCGTNLFVDVSKLGASKTESMPAVGPSGTEVLQIATLYNSHSVVRVRFVDDGIQQGSAHGNPVYYALKKHPSLKYKASTPDKPIDPHMNILTNPTEELYKLLIEAGGDESVFGFNPAPAWIKSKE
jgi:hypothetical protein